MVTSIQVSEKLKDKLDKRKLYDNESYEDVIWDLIDDSMELSEETKKNILQSEREFKEGKFKTLEQVKKDLGL